MRTLILLVAGLTLAVLPATSAHAYLDASTASMVVQMIVGGIAGGLIAGKLYWTKIKGFFARSPAEEPPSDEGGGAPQS